MAHPVRRRFSSAIFWLSLGLVLWFILSFLSLDFLETTGTKLTMEPGETVEILQPGRYHIFMEHTGPLEQVPELEITFQHSITRDRVHQHIGYQDEIPFFDQNQYKIFETYGNVVADIAFDRAGEYALVSSQLLPAVDREVIFRLHRGFVWKPFLTYLGALVSLGIVFLSILSVFVISLSNKWRQYRLLRAMAYDDGHKDEVRGYSILPEDKQRRLFRRKDRETSPGQVPEDSADEGRRLDLVEIPEKARRAYQSRQDKRYAKPSTQEQTDQTIQEIIQSIEAIDKEEKESQQAVASSPDVPSDTSMDSEASGENQATSDVIQEHHEPEPAHDMEPKDVREDAEKKQEPVDNPSEAESLF